MKLLPPPELTRSLPEFRKDHGDMTKVGFLIMSFGKSDAHKNIVKAIQNTLERNGRLAIRADNKQYNDNLPANIKTYMWGCGFGIAVFERIEMSSFNPNVAFESGYMLALQKPMCLLMDKTLGALPTDFAGKLYREFDTQDPGGSIPQVLEAWLHENEQRISENSKEFLRLFFKKNWFGFL